MKNNKVGRNALCSCGSGKKYKKCCLVKPISDSEEDNPAPPIKISNAIIKIAEPFLLKYKEKHRSIVLLELAIIAWNFTLTEGNDRVYMEDSLIKAMPKEIDAVGIVATIEIIDQLIERKNKLYPDINYIIINQKISISDDGVLNLDIGSHFVNKKEKYK